MEIEEKATKECFAQRFFFFFWFVCSTCAISNEVTRCGNNNMINIHSVFLVSSTPSQIYARMNLHQFQNLDNSAKSKTINRYKGLWYQLYTSGWLCVPETYHVWLPVSVMLQWPGRKVLSRGFAAPGSGRRSVGCSRHYWSILPNSRRKIRRSLKMVRLSSSQERATTRYRTIF